MQVKVDGHPMVDGDQRKWRERIKGTRDRVSTHEKSCRAIWYPLAFF